MTMSISPRAFLWDKAYPPPHEEDFVPKSGAWWEQYYTGLVTSRRLSEVAIQELTRTSREIAGLIPRIGDLKYPRPFKGLVVGAVQSGKTQSMMGVAATAMDNGYRVVIVLAGLKDDLRTQTARRFNTDLLIQSDPVLGIPGATTLGMPRGSRGQVHAYAPPYYTDCHDYAPLAPEMSRALKAGKPCVVVIKKHPASLSDLSMVMTNIYSEFGAENIPTLVLDDECDEATVPAGLQDKAIPEGIISLWSRVSPTPPVAYVGYTATAAANLLQHPDWELYPHWSYLLRYPGATNSAIEFAECIGDNWYTGSDCYYSDFGDEPSEDDNFLLVTSVEEDHLTLPIAQNESLLDALRAYFVSGAFRLALDPDRSFEDLSRLPAPHSMMIHTSSAREDHSRWADGIREMFGGTLDGDVTCFDCVNLAKIFEENEQLWKDWYQRFVQSRERIYEARPHTGVQRQPTWEQVRVRLFDVFKHTRLKVVNSDVSSSTLDYKPPMDQQGRPVRRPDLYVIAVGGSRLSRGITVEGLCISYFARWANTRHDDTVLQMSRWFGYRGTHLEFCRLFTSSSAYAGLREVAENDLQLRAQLSHLMLEKKSPQQTTLIFRASPYALPTAKTGAAVTLDLSFSPFTRVLSTLECGAKSAANETMALNLIKRVHQRSPVLVHRQGGLQRGYLSEGWSALEIAEILDAWEFENHNPPHDQNLLTEYYRPTDLGRPQSTLLDSRRDPYQVAAYLRYWTKWATEHGSAVPTFNVGIAFGELTGGTTPYDFPLLNRCVTPENEAIGGWTGSSSNWRGDIVFDNPLPELLDARKNRLENCAGLLLLYVVHKDAVGKAKNGKKRSHHSPFFGLSIPSGGPDFIRLATATGGPLVPH